MDIPARETLESAFQAYTGTMLFVSHDRYFIRQVAESLLIFDDHSVLYYPFGYEHYLERKARAAAADPAACIRAEEQALIRGLQSVPLPERHRLREQDTEHAYEDWQLRLSFEPVEQMQEALTQHWNTYDEYLSWTDPASASLWQETLDRLNEQYTAACLAWYDKWAEFHPEPDVQ